MTNALSRIRFGIETRLSLAMGVLASMAIAASLVAFLVFQEIREIVDVVIEESLPEISQAVSISKLSNRITAGAPAIVAATSEAERASSRAALDRDLTELELLVGALAPESRTGPAHAELHALTMQMGGFVEALDTATARRIALAERRREETALLLDVHDDFLTQLEPLIDDAVFELVLGLEAPETSAVAPEDVRTLDSLMTLAAEGNLAAGILNEATTVDDLRLLGPLIERFQAASGQLDRAAARLPATERYGDVRLAAQSLLHLGQLAGNVIELRRAELEEADFARLALESNRDAAAQLDARVTRLVEDAERTASATGGEAREVIGNSRFIILALSAGSLLVALLVIATYVRPRVIRPIEEMTDAMDELASGDADVRIPGQQKDDELGRMARALEVFRDMTQEVQQSNLQEVVAARRRLDDAIESISEAFSLYDKDDRLVLFNRKYLDMISPEMAKHIRPGMTFREVLELALEHGSVPDADGREEDWLNARIAAHQTAQQSRVVKFSNGTWINISERRTAEGGIVAVYSDITELMEREAELAEQSRNLQQLSSQLAKYLSPQVYQSIFSGEQQVALHSRRKKLTVFFSDISGFTETADRLESEDMTELLNEYLTEMSNIALAHGATIDKYIGDAIMIFFGDPDSQGLQEDAVRCVRMAIDMRNRLRELAAIWESRGLCETLSTRTGIHTGYCTVGNFGSEDRMDYTIIGGAVNLASRLEHSATPGQILISNETYNLVREEVQCREAETIRVKGIAYPVKTFVALHTHEQAGTQAGRVFEQHEKFIVDVDLDRMGDEERSLARETLRSVLKRLDQDEEIAPEQQPPLDTRKTGSD